MLETGAEYGRRDSGWLPRGWGRTENYISRSFAGFSCKRTWESLEIPIQRWNYTLEMATSSIHDNSFYFRVSFGGIKYVQLISNCNIRKWQGYKARWENSSRRRNYTHMASKRLSSQRSCEFQSEFHYELQWMGVSQARRRELNGSLAEVFMSLILKSESGEPSADFDFEIHRLHGWRHTRPLLYGQLEGKTWDKEWQWQRVWSRERIMHQWKRWCGALPAANKRTEENEVRGRDSPGGPTTLIFQQQIRALGDYVEGALEGAVCLLRCLGHGLTIRRVRALPSANTTTINIQSTVGRTKSVWLNVNVSLESFCPVLMVHDHIKQSMRKIRLELIGTRQLHLQMKRHARLMSKCAHFILFVRTMFELKLFKARFYSMGNSSLVTVEFEW